MTSARLQTQAAVLARTGEHLELMELQLPDLRAGQVLVDIAYSGVCHSQLNEARGLRGPDRYVPHTLGHEGSGVVVAVGLGVRKVRPGDHVVLSWLKGSGAEVSSTTYGSSRGDINSGAISTFMRRTVASENRVTVIPESMPLKLAALLGCAIPTGAGIVFNTSGLVAGDSVAVFGVGGIGLSAIMGAAAVGANPIIAVDMVAEKLEAAVRLGATHSVNAKSEDPIIAIHRLTANRGVKVAIECAGAIGAMESAYESVVSGGGLCVIAGNPPQGQLMRINPYSLISGRRIRGTWGGETNPDMDIPRYVDMFTAGRLPLGNLQTSDYALSEVNRALDDLEQGTITRAVLDMSLST